MPYDDIYPVIFQGLALNGFEVALSDTVGIDDRRKCDFIVFCLRSWSTTSSISKNLRLVKEFLLGFINPSFIHLLTDA